MVQYSPLILNASDCPICDHSIVHALIALSEAGVSSRSSALRVRFIYFFKNLPAAFTQSTQL